MKDYSSKLDNKVSEKIDVLNKTKEELENLVKDSFGNLEAGMQNAISKFEKESNTKLLEVIKRLENDAKTVIFDKNEYSEGYLPINKMGTSICR